MVHHGQTSLEILVGNNAGSVALAGTISLRFNLRR